MMTEGILFGAQIFKDNGYSTKLNASERKA
jgi:hypothetical protein